jgi:hypothetical protein
MVCIIKSRSLGCNKTLVEWKTLDSNPKLHQVRFLILDSKPKDTRFGLPANPKPNPKLLFVSLSLCVIVVGFPFLPNVCLFRSCVSSLASLLLVLLLSCLAFPVSCATGFFLCCRFFFWFVVVFSSRIWFSVLLGFEWELCACACLF